MVTPPVAPRVPGNGILDALSSSDYARVLNAGDIVPLTEHQVLYDFNTSLDSVWFPFSGVISWTNRDGEGHFVETAIGGREGFVGVQVLLGPATIAGHGEVQVAGAALEIEAGRFRELVAELPALLDGSHRFLLALLNQISQLSLCNRLHPMEERCARWLLMCHDRVDSDEFPMTHDYLSRMLGVRRASVSVTLGVLKAAAIIDYHQGMLTVLDRRTLEASSCECYGIVREEYERLLGVGRL
jgi:CRP-like cAMP-binding protein